MWAARQTPKAARAAAQGLQSGSKTIRSVPRASSSMRCLCTASPTASSSSQSTYASRSQARAYHASPSGKFASSSSVSARDRRGRPADDLEVVDQVAEDELDGDDLFGETTSDVDSAAAAPAAQSEFDQHTFQDLVTVMRESLFRFEKRETQNAPSRHLLSTIFRRASSLEELRDALACARLYMQLWYYRSKSFAKSGEISAQYFVDTCSKLNYPELCLNALAHPLDTGFMATHDLLVRVQTALIDKLRHSSGPIEAIEPRAKELLLESPTLEGCPQPLKEWNGTPESFKAGSASDAGEGVSPGEAEAVAEGEGATAESSVPETQAATDDQAQIALDRARLSVIDRIIIAASISSSLQRDTRLVDEQLVIRAIYAATETFKLEPEATSVTAIQRLEVFPRVDAMVRQLSAQIEMRRAKKTNDRDNGPVYAKGVRQAGARALVQAILRVHVEQKSGADAKHIERAKAHVNVVRRVMLEGLGEDPTRRSKFEQLVARLRFGKDFEKQNAARRGGQSTADTGAQDAPITAAAVSQEGSRAAAPEAGKAGDQNAADNDSKDAPITAAAVAQEAPATAAPAKGEGKTSSDAKKSG